jgi:transcriptional regulator with XRE-family HTH domain
LGTVVPTKEAPMKTTKELLGARIKELRRNKKISQEELAEQIGVEPQHMSRIESGRSYPSIDRLEKISTALKVPLKDFFEFMHLENVAERLKSIDSLAKDLSEERQRFAYKILKALQEM